jgi:hypothetical protein
LCNSALNPLPRAEPVRNVISTGTTTRKGLGNDGDKARRSATAIQPRTVSTPADVTRHHRVASAAQWVERPVGGVFNFLSGARAGGYFFR